MLKSDKKLALLLLQERNYSVVRDDGDPISELHWHSKATL
jgi:hypothetical protein